MRTLIPKPPKNLWVPRQPFQYERLYDVVNWIYSPDTKSVWPVDARGPYYVDNLTDKPHWMAQKGRFKGEPMLANSLYNEIIDIVVYARLNGLIPWEAIADDNRQVSIKVGRTSEASYINDTLKYLFRSWSDCLAQNQPNHIEVWVEKNGLFRTCETVADEYCRQVVSTKGQQSQHFLHEYVMRAHALGAIKAGKKLVILYFGDFNPAGMSIPQAITDSLNYTHGLIEHGGVHLVRCALEPHQLAGLKPKPAPMKGKGKIKAEFIKQFGNKHYELNALGYKGLQAEVRKALIAHTDIDILEADCKANETTKERFEELHKITVNFAKQKAKDLRIIN